MDQAVLETLELNKVSSFTYGEILLNLSLAFVLGMIISYVYKITHKGLSYSQSFILTIVFVTVIVSMVIMVIENNLARAFALVGALSIIRFRTVVKDTKDTAFIFLGLIGITNGFANVLGSSTWAEIYGVKFIGSIKALTTALMVFSTAFGTALFGVLIDRGFSIEGIALIGATYIVVSLILLLIFKKKT